MAVCEEAGAAVLASACLISVAHLFFVVRVLAPPRAVDAVPGEEALLHAALKVHIEWIYFIAIVLL